MVMMRRNMLTTNDVTIMSFVGLYLGFIQIISFYFYNNL